MAGHRSGIIGIALVACAAAVNGQRPLNLDFERPGVALTDRPWGWTQGFSPFVAAERAGFALDSSVRHSGERSLRIAIAESAADVPVQFLRLQIPAAFAVGRPVTLRAWTRTRDLRRRALVALEAWAPGRVSAADTALTHGPTSDWARHELSILVDSSAHSVVVSVALDGPGTVWFDHFELTVDGTPVRELVTGPAATPADIRWLGAHSAPLRHVEPPMPNVAPDDADLAMFDRIVGDARIVGLGESTHGTHEFFQVKHRLLEYLVRRHGFTVFAIEANQIAVRVINDYVHGGSGTARDVMRTMFRVWNTESMHALIEWMRAYNAARPERPLHFIGYDMQDHRRTLDSLRAFLERSDPQLLPSLNDLTAYRAQSTAFTPGIADSIRLRWYRATERVWQQATARRAAWLAGARSAADSIAVEWSVQAANLLHQVALNNSSQRVSDRDSLMAANIEWALGTLHPEARVVVWAHDVHVSKGGDPQRSFYRGATMGAQLKRIFGDAYRTFSLLTYEGAYSATRSFSDHTTVVAEALPAPAGSLEAALHRVSRPAGTVGLILDLRGARGSADAAWLQRPHRLRHVGYAAYDFQFELEAVFPLEFDAVVFADRSTASRLLP